jgi:hypothetical protein
MKDLLRKLRELDKWLEATTQDPNFHKVLADAKDGERDMELFAEMTRTIYQMRASAKMQDMDIEKEELASA